MSHVQPLVSIISPAYNHEKFILDCIQSVLKQTYTNWEMIIVDDGSTDVTYSIAKTIANTEPRIKVFTQKNVGIFRLNETYNFALKQSRGKYIAVLECDDLWLPDKLSKQIEILEKQPQCVLSWGKSFLSSADLKFDYYIAPQDTTNSELFFNKPVGAFFRKYLFDVSVPALTLVIRKDILLEIGGFQQGFNLPLVDIPTILELLTRGEFAYLDEPLGKWRIYPNQITKTYTGQGAFSYYLLIQSFINRFPNIFNSSGFKKKEVDNKFHALLVISYSRSGRYKLIRKDFKGARKDYLHSIKIYGFTEPMWKMRSIAGIFLSFLKLDVEWLAALFGKQSYKP